VPCLGVAVDRFFRHTQFFYLSVYKIMILQYLEPFRWSSGASGSLVSLSAIQTPKSAPQTFSRVMPIFPLTVPCSRGGVAVGRFSRHAQSHGRSFLLYLFRGRGHSWRACMAPASTTCRRARHTAWGGSPVDGHGNVLAGVQRGP
jgi:hypothetical protein